MIHTWWYDVVRSVNAPLTVTALAAINKLQVTLCHGLDGWLSAGRFIISVCKQPPGQLSLPSLRGR